MATAFMRAQHVHIDGKPPILDDSIAFDLIPGYQQRFIRRIAALSLNWRARYRLKNGISTNMRTHIVVRARYAEDALQRARQSGASRYIILAAGLDTFAFRQSTPAVVCVEIDHPATQQWKRELLRERGISEPAELTFVPIDFESETLAEVWPDSDETDFVSWLGVSYYLSSDAIRNTLQTIAARTRPGSQMVLDFWQDAPPREPAGRMLWSTRLAVALQQEPMRSFFDPDEIAELAGEAGWRVHAHLTPSQQTELYLVDRDDRLALPEFAHLLHLTR